MASSVASIPLPGVALGAGGGFSARSAQPLALRSFYAGPENLLVAVAVEGVLDPAQPRFSPLLLLGPSGVGKTHLAQGIARRWSETGQPGEAVYLTGSEFAKQFAAAIESDTVRSFRSRMRSAELFVLDDLTKLAKKPPALKELLFTLDALEQRGAATVVTSRTPPVELEQFPAALASRLAGGLVLTLSLPGVRARRAILEELAAAKGIELAPQAAEALAGQLAASVPELLQSLLQLASSPTIDSPRARRFLADRGTRDQPSATAILTATAKQFSLKPSDLKGSSRNRTVVAARSIAMYLIRQLTGQSLEQIGGLFGGRDHTTALYSCRKVEKLMHSDPPTRQTIAKLQKSLTK